MAKPNQDFETYRGDDVLPIFTVYQADGTTIQDISSVSDISWSAQRNLSAAAALTKTKLGGQIAFVTDGTDGKFQVTITAVDTAALTGFYLHTASLTDALGKITTVTIGRMQVGQAPAWTWDPTQLATSSLYQVRALIGDTLIGDQQFSDPEIQYCVDSFTNVYLAAAQACRNLSLKYARQVDLVQGDLQTNYSQRSVRYEKLAMQLQSRGEVSGVGAGVWAGGISVTDKRVQEADPDRVQPQFVLGMSENLVVPLPPVGQETQSNPQSPPSNP